MTEINQDFVLYQGDTKILRVEVFDTEGNPKNIAGASILWGMYVFTQPQIVLTKSTSGGITITDAINGIFEVQIDSADSLDLEPDFYGHEAEVTDIAGNVSTIFTGTVEVRCSRIGVGA